MNGNACFDNMVRVGTVSSVNTKDRTARVLFKDKDDIVSAPLKVLINQPHILFRQWTKDESVMDDEDPQLVKVFKISEGADPDYEHIFHSHYPKDGVGEKYAKGELAEGGEYETYATSAEDYEHKPDCIKGGMTNDPPHGQLIKVYPWLPYIGQLVVCLFPPNADGDGFILGGL